MKEIQEISALDKAEADAEKQLRLKCLEMATELKMHPVDTLKTAVSYFEWVSTGLVYKSIQDYFTRDSI